METEVSDNKVFISTDLECPVCGEDSVYIFVYGGVEEYRCTYCGSSMDIVDE